MKKAMMFIVSAIVSITMSIIATIGNTFGTTITAEAATLADLNRSEVFLKQINSVSCTRCSAAMLIRRVAMMRGDSDWMNITEEAISNSCWADVGLLWDFTYDGIRIVHGWLPEDYNTKVNTLISMLDNCPEGVIGYWNNHHAVLLLDYSDGVFYCADPANSTPSGRIPVDQSLISVNDMNAYWYCTSPLVSLSASESNITITNPRYPEGELPLKQPFSIAGIIHSNYVLNSVKAGIAYADGTPTPEFVYMNPNDYSFDLYDQVDWSLRFDALPTGNYKYIVSACDVNDFSQLLIESNFTVVDDSPSSIFISDANSPETLKLGETYSITGGIYSHHALKRVYGGVYTATGEPTAQYLDVTTSGNSYDLAAEFDSALHFNDLSAGEYTYKIYATDIKDYSQLLIERSFTVAKPEPVYHGEYAKAIDTSEFQGNIDWNMVAESGIEYVIIRAGSTYYEDASVLMTDEKFQYNYKHAKAAGLKIGAYVYTSAVSSKEMTANINSLLSIIQGCKLDLPVFLDVEQSNRQIAIGNKALTSLLLTGCNQIRNAGFNPGVYANEDWFSHYVDASVLRKNEIVIWKAAWVNDDPLNYDHSGSCSIFQYSETGSIPGIAGHVDLDLVYNPSVFAAKPNIEEVAQYQLGDVNCDERVDVSDAVLLSRFVAEDASANITASGKKAADADQSGHIDLDDVVFILQIIAKII